jgi:GTPase SAR1 family protein
MLNIVAQVRKCRLESILALPQLVMCGDQSARKSSILEALTKIPFPRNNKLYTRFATEIIMRRSTVDSLTIKVIPDNKRPTSEKESIKTFAETIQDFKELPKIMDRAIAVMGIGTSAPQASAFARDVLSVEIKGPLRPQLTFVDLPSLIQNKTKGVTKADIELVQEITDRYISQSRTIILAIVSATNDYANQGILTKARKVDPDRERTLSIITKPDRLPASSGSESAYINLARNEDIFFKLS